MVDNINAGASASGDDQGVFKLQDRWLPIANVGRIMKQTLPPNAKISKEAKETMQECVSEFISFVTGEASEKCKKERRKTVNGDDVCWAMGKLGFDEYVGPLKRYLQRYREAEGDNRANNNQDQRASNSNTEDQDQDQDLERDDHHQEPSSSYRYNLQLPAAGKASGSSSRPY